MFCFSPSATSLLIGWCSCLVLQPPSSRNKWKKDAVIPTLILCSLTPAHHLLSDLQIPSWRGGPCPWRDSRTYGGVGAWGSAHHPHPAPRYPSITGHLPQPAPQAWRPHERAHDWAVGLQLWPSKGAKLDVKRTTNCTVQLYARLQPSELTSRLPAGWRFTPFLFVWDH